MLDFDVDSYRHHMRNGADKNTIDFHEGIAREKSRIAKKRKTRDLDIGIG